MTRNEIVDFIEKNQGDRIIDFYNKLYEKLKELNKRNDRISLFLILVVIAYFLTSKSTLSSIQFGPFSTTDFSIIPKLTPVLFSYFLLEFAVVNGHRAEILKTTKWISLLLYNHNLTPKDLDDTHYNYFVRLVLPFSFWVEIGKLNDQKSPIGCLGTILFLPLLSLFFLPFYFEYLTIKNLITLYWTDWVGKIATVVSIWLTLFVIYFYAKLLPKSYKMVIADSKK